MGALPIPTDVADAEAVEAAAERIDGELGPIGVWVNVASHELMIQPSATMMPPKAITNFDPRRAPRLSTIHPSIGVSQVSNAMKMAESNSPATNRELR